MKEKRYNALDGQNDYFRPFLSLFKSPPVQPLMLQRAFFFDQKGTKKGRKTGHFWVILDHFWVDPGSFWGQLGIILDRFYSRLRREMVQFMVVYAEAPI